ncbi:MAG: PspA/IM30 family protein [Deltaproteobacteria bacterium]|nr:MAG: PspA/IM30 family protein [Deltaproteobacteria bacterium]
MTTRQRGLLGRVRGLIQGLLRGWVRDRENESPRAVYEEAIAERGRQYRELKQAVAGILYMRNKLEAEIRERRVEIAALYDDIRRAVTGNDDDAAVVLIQRKEDRQNELAHAEQELAKVRSGAAEAKVNLARFREEIRNLEREKVRMLATIANARARRRIQVALEGLSVESDLQALENVRQHVAELVAETRLDTELGDDGLERRIREIREESRAEAARRELAEIKRRLRPAEIRIGAPTPGAATARG